MKTFYKNHLFILLFYSVLVVFAMPAKAHAAPLVPSHAHPSTIHISEALHLNANRKLISDITKQVKVQDNVYATIHNGEYVRVTFEQALDNTYDNSIYARPAKSNNVVSIEVYPVYTRPNGDQIESPSIATFPSIDHEGFYKILLTKLHTPTNTFDFKITGGVDIDYIVDPTYTVVYNFSFSGTVAEPANYGTLVLSGNTIYSMGAYGEGPFYDGGIFSITTTGGSLTDLHDFSGNPTDGSGVEGSLILSGNTLYGMTANGGTSNDGIIFSIATTGGNYTILHNFSGGTTDGANPQYSSSLIISGSTLYGMTNGGGANNNGIIFSIATTGGSFTILHNFNEGSPGDGGTPFGSLIISGSTLYGMTEFSYGGIGMIFSIATTGGSFTDLHDFSGYLTDGGQPLGSLALSGSTLYGMTYVGGIAGLNPGDGIIFSIATTGGNYSILHSFTGSSTDGSRPYGSLIDVGNTLYGMTGQGGANGYGIMFSIATTGGNFTDLHDFSGPSTDGYFPDGTFALSGCMLYAPVEPGGSGNAGMIFSYYSPSVCNNGLFFGTDF